MHGLYVYGIVESRRDFSTDIAGIDGTPVTLVPWRRLAAVVSDVPLRGYPPTPANAARHGAVVEQVMQEGPILPMRFGTLLGGRQRVTTMLEGHADAFEKDLHRLRGRVEMGLKVLWEAGLSARQSPTVEGRAQEQAGCVGLWGDECVNPPAGPGSRYLLRRLEEEQRTEAVRARGEERIQMIQASLCPLADEWALECFPTPRLLLDAAYLVPREALHAFRDGVEGLEETPSDLRFLLSGPWPPYSFVRLCLNEDSQANRGRALAQARLPRLQERRDGR